MYTRLTVFAIVALTLGLATDVAYAKPVSHWTFDEGAGTSVVDVTGSGRDGRIMGNPTWVSGMVGGALELTNDGDYVVISTSEQIRLRSTDTFTVAVWVNVRDLGGGIILQHGLGCSTFASWFLGVGGPEPDVTRQEGNLMFGVRSDNSAAYTSVAAPAEADAWVHVAASYDGTTLTLYIDGLEVQSVDAPEPWASNENLYIGGDPGCGGRNWYTGSIDDLWIFDHALTQAEVIALISGEPITSAFAPRPANGATVEQASVTLRWTPGDFAVSHAVYFSDGLEAVDDGQVEPVATTQASLDTASMPAYAAGLTPGQTYYWRVDEVSDTHADSPWRGEVWSFSVRPLTASNPSPADGIKYVSPNQVLSWDGGLGGIIHYVHFGESFDQVSSVPSLTGWPTVKATHNPGPLKLETTYYWRVDEFTGTATHKGQVWSFTTAPEVAATDPDLAGWWTLDEGMGTTAVDWSGLGNHGTIIGGPQWVAGLHGGALEFSAVGQYIDCGTGAGEDITGDFTLAAWVKLAPANAGMYGGIAGRLANPGTYMGFALVRHATNVFRLWVGDGDSAGINGMASSDVLYTDTEWHHVAGVREGQGNFLYVDGVKQVETTNTGFVPSPQFFHIGRQYSHLNDRYFRGKIDDVRVYGKALDEDGIQEIMRGQPLLAGAPEPAAGAIVDVRGAGSLGWQAGDTAASHDVYFGTDRGAVAAADRGSAEYQGNRTGTGFSLAGLVEFGGGDYYWRIDEVEADGTTIHQGYTWRFTVPAYLIVDDFEGYIDDYETGEAIFEAWLDGATNNTGSTVGYWEAPFAERTFVHTGSQSMPLDYNNVNPPYYSEGERTWDATQDWTVEGVDTLTLYIRGKATNGPDTLYVALKDAGNKVGIVTYPNPDLVKTRKWTEWRIPLADFDVNPATIKTLYIGVGDRDNPAPGGAGLLYIDDIRLVKADVAE